MERRTTNIAALLNRHIYGGGDLRPKPSVRRHATALDVVFNGIPSRKIEVAAVPDRRVQPFGQTVWPC